jgi:hypothetical protein
LSLNNKKKYFNPVNCYNGSVTVITVHLNTQKYSKVEKLSKKPECIMCNDSVIVVTFYETYNSLVNRYYDSAQSDPTVILSKSL